MTIVALGNICEFVYGKALPKSKREEGRFPVYGSNGVVGTHTEALSGSETIVIGRKGSIGELNYSPTPCWPIDTTYFVDRNSTREDMRWLFYALHALRLPELNKATGVPGLNRNDAYERKIFLPSRDEQRRIAAILDKADIIRRRREQVLTLADDFLWSVFLGMFGDPSANPMGHSVKNFETILLIPLRNGISPSSKGKISANVLTLTAITGTRFDADQVKEGKFLEPIAAKDAVNRSDFYICRGNGSPDLIGKGYFADRDIAGTAFPDTMIAAKPDPHKVTQAYLERLWNSPFVRNQIREAARTTNGTFKINQTAAGAIRIPVPPLVDQRKYQEIVDKVGRSVSKLGYGNDLFPSLSQRAFRGEI